MNLKERAKKLKMDIPAIFLALKKKETPSGAKILAGIVIIYALSPIDLIPDFVPLLGYLDDIILLPALIALTMKLIPKDIIKQCQMEAKELWTDKKPQKWFFALPIITIWILIVYLIVKFIFF